MSSLPFIEAFAVQQPFLKAVVKSPMYRNDCEPANSRWSRPPTRPNEGCLRASVHIDRDVETAQREKGEDVGFV
jgi:hypothetical protein